MYFISGTPVGVENCDPPMLAVDGKIEAGEGFGAPAKSAKSMSCKSDNQSSFR